MSFANACTTLHMPCYYDAMGTQIHAELMMSSLSKTEGDDQ